MGKGWNAQYLLSTNQFRGLVCISLRLCGEGAVIHKGLGLGKQVCYAGQRVMGELEVGKGGTLGGKVDLTRSLSGEQKE